MTDGTIASRQQEAARWFAASRRGVMSLEERAAYARWREDRANAATLAEFEGIWQALEEVEGDIFASNTGTKTRHPPTSRFARPALVAAMCAVSLVIGVLSYSTDSHFWTALDWAAR